MLPPPRFKKVVYYLLVMNCLTFKFETCDPPNIVVITPTCTLNFIIYYIYYLYSELYKSIVYYLINN